MKRIYKIDYLQSIYVKNFEIYSDKLFSQIQILEDEFKILIKDINLEEKWSHEKFEEIEIKKCFIRSALRYSANSQILLNILNNEIAKIIISETLFGLLGFIQ